MQIHTHPSVLELAEIQKAIGLPDGDFARTVKLGYTGSSWGKIKNGTWSGNPDKALRAVQDAVAFHRIGGQIEVIDGTVMFDHVLDSITAVEVARAARDEHKLVVISGSWGAGKSVTLTALHSRFGGHYIHARPSWSGSYLRALLGLGNGIGLATAQFRSVGQAETEVLAALAASPALLLIDEANHFSRDSLNFLKTVLNETRAAIVLATLPGHLGRIAAMHSEETRQLLRRAVSIVHIGPVSSADVIAIHSGLYPHLHLGHAAPAIAACANRHYRFDTVCRCFEEANPDDPDDLTEAVQRVEKAAKTILQNS